MIFVWGAPSSGVEVFCMPAVQANAGASCGRSQGISKSEADQAARCYREYAQSSTAPRALWQMEKDCAPIAERPQPWQSKNFRPQRQKKGDLCRLLGFPSFAGSTPATVKIDESSMLWTETEVRILFCCSGAEQQMAKLKLSGFL